MQADATPDKKQEGWPQNSLAVGKDEDGEVKLPAMNLGVGEAGRVRPSASDVQEAARAAPATGGMDEHQAEKTRKCEGKGGVPEPQEEGCIRFSGSVGNAAEEQKMECGKEDVTRKRRRDVRGACPGVRTSLLSLMSDQVKVSGPEVSLFAFAHSLAYPDV